MLDTGNAFHGVCLAAEVMDLSPPDLAARIASLLKRLAQVTHPGWGDHSKPPLFQLMSGFCASQHCRMHAIDAKLFRHCAYDMRAIAML